MNAFYVRHISLVNTPRTIMLQSEPGIRVEEGGDRMVTLCEKMNILQVVNLLKKP